MTNAFVIDAVSANTTVAAAVQPPRGEERVVVAGDEAQDRLLRLRLRPVER